MSKAKARLITIIVEGGCVQEVENLPDNWEYEIVDNDMNDDEEDDGDE